MKQNELIKEIIMNYCLGEVCKSDDLVNYLKSINDKAVIEIEEDYKKARKPVLEYEKDAKIKEDELKKEKLLLMTEEIRTNLENELKPIIRNEVINELKKSSNETDNNSNLLNDGIVDDTVVWNEKQNSITQTTATENKIVNNDMVDKLTNSIDWIYETGIIKSNHEKFNVFITKSENDAATIFYKKHNNYLIRRITNIDDNNKLGFKEELFDPNLKIWKDISNTQF